MPRAPNAAPPPGEGAPCFWCRRGDYAGALRCYQRGLEAAEAAPSSTRAALLSNVAAAQLGLEQWEEGFLAARQALALDPTSTKARHRLARAMLHLRCYGPALEHLHTVVEQVCWLGGPG